MISNAAPASSALWLRTLLALFLGVALLWGVIQIQAADPAASSAIHHSYLVTGSQTAIIGEDGAVIWKHTRGSRDGFVLPSGNVLLAFADHVEEVTRDKQVVFSYKRSPDNAEIGTTERL